MGIYDRDYYQDDEMRPLRPWDGKSMVTLLIIACAIAWLANFIFTSRTSALTILLALRPGDLASPLNWYRFISYGFAHDASPWHLIFNMFTLYFLGRNVEDKYGKWEFFRIYLVSILLCGLGWSLLHYASEGRYTLVGASGAVTTIAMLFVFSFPQATLMLYGVIPIKAWVMGIAIVAMNVLGSRSVNMPGSNEPMVAYDVHLIGAGLAAIYFFANLNLSFLSGWLDRGREGISRGRTVIRQKQRGLKVHKPDPWSADPPQETAPSRDEIEADRLLDKIHREGKDSLTTREQAFLEEYSRKVRQQRR
ncbi:MAG: rhomboid family intramembrane serine protease [Pirellulaceae bacterium]